MFLCLFFAFLLLISDWCRIKFVYNLLGEGKIISWPSCCRRVLGRSSRSRRTTCQWLAGRVVSRRWVQGGHLQLTHADLQTAARPTCDRWRAAGSATDTPTAATTSTTTSTRMKWGWVRSFHVLSSDSLVRPSHKNLIRTTDRPLCMGLLGLQIESIHSTYREKNYKTSGRL